MCKKIFSGLLACLLLAVCLAGCGMSASKGANNIASDAAPGRTGNSYDVVPQENGVYGDMVAEGNTSFSQGAGVQSAPMIPAAVERKIIYTSDVSLSTKEFADTTASLRKTLTQMDGYVESSRFYGTEEDGDRYAELVCRIPAGRYTEFMTAVQAAAIVMEVNENTQDVTAAYVDVQARIDSLTAQKQRLQELLTQAATLEDMLVIESRLSDVQYELESYQRQLNVFDDQIDYSTVTVYVSETRTTHVQQSRFGDRVSGAFSDMWQGLISGSQNFVIGLILALPALVILGGIALVIILAVRRAVKKSRAAAQKPAPQPASAAQTKADDK